MTAVRHTDLAQEIAQGIAGGRYPVGSLLPGRATCLGLAQPRSRTRLERVQTLPRLVAYEQLNRRVCR
jgi:hypothetical protein